MKGFCIFDDFPEQDIELMETHGVELEVLPKGCARPSGDDLTRILLANDVIVIGTGQKIEQDFFDGVNGRKYIVTASTGTDHIKIPDNKKDLVKVINAPTAIFSTVAEHVFALILAQEKLLFPARETAYKGLHKKAIGKTPNDVAGQSIGIIGYGRVGQAVAKLARAFSMKIRAYDVCAEKYCSEKDVKFLSLDEILGTADILVLSVPLLEGTRNLVSSEKIDLIRDSSMFISVSRPESCDNQALFEKAEKCPDFRVCLDYDADKVQGLWNRDNPNVIVTPHIAGGTVQSRIRLFDEATRNFIEGIENE